VSALNKIVDDLRVHSLDYAGWDEMLRAVRQRDVAWAVDNIDNWVGSTFGVDAVYLFNTDNQIVHHFSNQDRPGLEEVIKEQGILERVYEDTSASGFFEYNGQIYFYGASLITWSNVEITDDNYFVIGDDTPIGGVYLAVTALDSEIEETAKEISGKKIAYISRGDIPTAQFEDYLVHDTIISRDTVMHHDRIIDAHGNVIGFSCMTKSRDITALMRNNIYRIVAVLSLTVALFVVFWMLITYLILSRPLNLLAKDITGIKPEEIEPLDQAKRSDEIGGVAKAFNEAALTIRRYQSDIESSRAGLEKANKEVSDRLDTINTMNKFMVGRELEMGHLKKQVAKYKSILKRNKLKDPFEK